MGNRSGASDDWATVTDFLNYGVANYTNNYIGVQTVPEAASSVQVGDYSYDTNPSTGLKHAVFEAEVGSPVGWNSIAISSHTVELGQLFDTVSQPSYFQLMKVVTFRSS